MSPSPRAGYDPSAARCGLLLDDWAETIPAIEADEPGPQHTTGVAFNFDRPSQEPPQAMLLLTPAQWDGAWSWEDVVHGVIDTFELARLRAVEPCPARRQRFRPVPAGDRRQRHHQRPARSRPTSRW